jgi:hypothetical protein
MACIIAPTAGKLVMSPSPTTVPADIQKIAIQMDADKRLAAAAGGVARYYADAAGLASDAVTRLQSAVLGVCEREVDLLSQSNQRLEVVCKRTNEAIEVAVIRRGSGDAAGNQTEQAGEISGVDRVQHETQADKEITRLTKFLTEAAFGD